MRPFINLCLASAVLAFFYVPAAIAQDASISFGAGEYDPERPVEVSADQLSVDQSDGSAVFNGNVVVVQDSLRMSAGSIRVEYAEGDAGGISRLVATGGVTLVSGEEAAEAQEAVYSIDAGTVVLTGDVLLTQARTAISGDRLEVDLSTGTGVMRGRVRTVLQTGEN